MSIDVTTAISEYIASLGLEAGKNWIKNKFNEKKLSADLKSYIEKQQKYNELCTLKEEIDFQGLIDYIQENLLEDAGTRFLDPNQKKRKRAREDIIAAAVEYSKAETSDAKKRVATCISICLDIIRNFYRSKFAKKDYLLADEIVDAVAEIVNETVQESKDDILKQMTEMKKEIIDKSDPLFSLDKTLALANSGKLSSIGDGITTILEHISLTHPCKPYYEYDYNHGKLVSKPRDEDAIRMYPPKMVLSGAVRFGNQYYNTCDTDFLEYSYRHQLPFTMEVTKAIKYLGEKQDPIQDEAIKFVGNTVVVTPPKFPPAFPCSIKVRDKTFFEYVLLRTQEIEDDGTYIISNKEQNSSLYFEARINPNNPQNPDFKINVDHTNNREWLNYARFIEAISKDKDIHIYVLSEAEDIIAGIINNINYHPVFPSIEEEVDFLDRVCIIEDYFKVKLDICGDLSRSEYDTIIHMSNLIQMDEVIDTWNEAIFTGIITQTFREKILSMEDLSHLFSYVGVRQISLFGVDIEYSHICTYQSARIKDLEKLKQKVNVLDDGDNIKFTLCPGENNKIIISLRIPEAMEE